MVLNCISTFAHVHTNKHSGLRYSQDHDIHEKEQKSVFLSAEEHLTANVIHMLLNGSQQLIYVESRVTIASNPKGYKESNSVTN